MSFQIDDPVQVTSESAPYYTQQGVVKEVDGGYRVLPLVGVLLKGHSVLHWYTELELGAPKVDAPTEEIAVVAP